MDALRHRWLAHALDDLELVALIASVLVRRHVSVDPCKNTEFYNLRISAATPR
jgi:hypothetical protein